MRRAASRSSVRRSIVTLGVVIATSVTVLSTALVLLRYQEVVEDARDNVGTLSALLAAQANQGVQGVEILRNKVMDRLIARGADGPEAFRAAASSRAFHDEIAQMPDTFELLDAVTVVDDGGRILNSSRLWPPPRADVADRDYFQALSAPGALTVWSKVPANRSNGKPMIVYATRFQGTAGRLLGMVLASISVEKLQTFFGRLAGEKGYQISFYRTDGTLLASSPTLAATPMAIARKVAEISQAAPRDSLPHAVFDSEGADGSAAIVSVSRLPDYPLVMAVSARRADLLAGWRREAIGTALLTLLLNITAGIAGLLGLRHLAATRRAYLAEQHAARHDALTSLPNRTLLTLRLSKLLGEPDRAFFLLVIDLDRFKEINDSFGHPLGDGVLKTIAARLGAAVRPRGFLARLGGDEFAIVLDAAPGEAPIEAAAEQFRRLVSRPIQYADVEVTVPCSIGVAVAHRDGTTAADLISAADLAVSLAKQAGRGATRRYSPEMGLLRKERVSLLRDLRRAVEACELELYFQPIVSLRTRRITGFEALLRWRDRERGFVPPALFVPLAEESGLILRIGAFVLREACRWAATWPEDLKVSVNLSPTQFCGQDIFAETEAALVSAGLPPNRLMLEITESVQLDQTRAGRTLHRLHEHGVGIALDDFGTGYASLSYLRSFPFDVIKIDQSFVRDMIRSMDSQIIVQTVLAMSERLGMAVTAEGVESAEQLDLLRLGGCRNVQGYLLGKPMPAAQVLPFLAGWTYPRPEPEPVAALAG